MTTRYIIFESKHYKTKFKIGDMVKAPNYMLPMIIVAVNEYLTSSLKKLHWTMVSEDYILGTCKTNNADPCSDSELTFLTNQQQNNNESKR